MITQERFSEEPAADEPGAEADPVVRLRLQLDELQAYVRQQWAARTDRALLGLRRLALLAFLGIAALVAVAAWIVTAVVLFLKGASDGLGLLLGGRFWLASLIVGATALVLVAAAAMATYAVWAAASKQRTRIKYEHRQHEQRRRFGRTAHDRANK
ncbi:MAG TPA: hypothetical protein VG125_32875 [Pirellulales bacterium]|jgi:hypothetical protein|nr:hypothetical protein [Pirellulales bacterium]